LKNSVTIHGFRGSGLTEKPNRLIVIQPQKSTKYTKIAIYILEYQMVMDVRNINLDFLQDHQS